MKARVRANVDRDRPRLRTSGITRAITTTGTKPQKANDDDPDSQVLTNGDIEW